MYTVTMMRRVVTVVLISFLALAQSQQYQAEYDQDYANDNLYHDYAMRQQEKDVGKP